MRIKQLSTASFLLSFIPLSATAVTYTVEDLGTVDNVKSSYAMKSNAAGDVAATAKDRFEPNLGIDPEDGDDELDDDIDDNINDDINDEIEDDDEDEDEDYLEPPQGNEVAFATDGNASQRLVIFDVIEEETGEFSGSTNDIAFAINDGQMLVGMGTAPYYAIPYTEEDGDELTYFARDFQARGYVYVIDEALPLLAPNIEYGGVSLASDINNSNLVVGYASIDLTESSRDYAEDICPEQDVPLAVCTRALNYQLRAYQWQLDDQGNVLSTKELGMLATPDEDDDRQFLSQALAVNDQAVSVGMSYAFEDGDDDLIRTYAAIYQNDQVIDITDPDEYRASIAYDISDENAQGVSYVVGDVTRLINGYWRSKFFYYELGKEGAELTSAYGDGSPVTDFYNGSSSTARSVNSSGYVVGFGEYERVNPQIPRRKHAFVYDINTNTFSDLNALLPCDSEYEIVEANHIDEENNIMAVALISVPAVDDDGEPVIGDDGEQETEEVARAVRLNIDLNGIPEVCPEEEEESFSRSGAANSFISFFGLLSAAILRRRWLIRKVD
ncbi:DUF3466 family protein [Corallincola spongiicola]|uniref:DUF3466 family protein n=1 Tax=Corallincola spongiicola TaxID=2520508 RepID=A0ABY1WTS7_9GAMM|nr:DUF3466 family protein [Corallincola spongiicola]TAA48146.1 DUF3466 family protein [Corallincola spongiicola]